MRDNLIRGVETGAFPAILGSLQYLDMTNNPSQCYVGANLMLAKVVYCSCAPTFIALPVSSCQLYTGMDQCPLSLYCRCHEYMYY